MYQGQHGPVVNHFGIGVRPTLKSYCGLINGIDYGSSVQGTNTVVYGLETVIMYVCVHGYCYVNVYVGLYVCIVTQ